MVRFLHFERSGREADNTKPKDALAIEVFSCVKRYSSERKREQQGIRFPDQSMLCSASTAMKLRPVLSLMWYRLPRYSGRLCYFFLHWKATKRD